MPGMPGMPLFDDVMFIIALPGLGTSSLLPTINYLIRYIIININQKFISGKETTGINDFNLNNI